MYKNLALKGGGVKGIAYVGALYELDKRGCYRTLERVSGTSAGALVALMVALQLSPSQIEELMKSLNFNDFKSGWNPFRIFSKYGLYSGDVILKFIDKYYQISGLNINKNTTFKEFVEAGGKDIIVFASNLNEQNINEFSSHQTPDCILAEAVRASMSIPLFFKSWKFSNGIPNDHIYVDGGVMFNYPLSFFDKPRFHEGGVVKVEDSIGLFLEPKKFYEMEAPSPLENQQEHISTTRRIINKLKHITSFGHNQSIFKYTKLLFGSLMNSQDIELFEEIHLTTRTIFIDDLGISATKFNLTHQDKENLMIAGRVGAERYFDFIESKENN